MYLLFDGAFILVDSHPALYFLLEFRLCWEKMFWHEGKFSPRQIYPTTASILLIPSTDSLSTAAIASKE
ncbi:hypothetical protein DW116_12145 [[Ruminococcus] lactaris]|uniref:Uncharacterized protein n=1 Tax=[Ruminococcus] lactaris TaxID=46228 RepID=A0A415CVY5_9FIRM|nr:hypothetical protein DW116_12145 [[Ruminococcus] lactaris]